MTERIAAFRRRLTEEVLGHTADVDARLLAVGQQRRAAARSRAEVDELLAQLRPKHFSTELMIRPHTAAEASV